MSEAIRDSFIQKLNKFEIQCVTGNFTDLDCEIDLYLPQIYRDCTHIKDLVRLMKNVSNHEYEKALQANCLLFSDFKEYCKDIHLSFDKAYNGMKSNYKFSFRHHNDPDPFSYVKQLVLLLIGVSALQAFVKVNICGPTYQRFVNDILSEPVFQSSDLHEICNSVLPESLFSKEKVLKSLERNGEVILAKIQHPKLLLLSLMLLFGNNFDKCLTHKWWLARCMMINQKFLTDNCSSLHRYMCSLISSQTEMSFLQDKSEILASFMFNIECAQIHMHYNELNDAEKYIIIAQNILGLGVKFSEHSYRGVEDPPTKSLVVVKRNDNRYCSTVITNNKSFPKCLFDLNKAKSFLEVYDSDNKRTDELLPEEQIILLLYCDLFIKRKYDRGYSDFHDDIAILSFLLSKSKIWSIHMKAIVLRCKRKSRFSSSRSLEINSLTGYLNHVSDSPTSVNDRLPFIYCTSLPTIIGVLKLIGDIYYEWGLFINSLNIYKHLHCWDRTTQCYKVLSDLQVGILELETQIAIKPSPVLWCCFGDLTNRVDIYQVAWELSVYTNPRAARKMGYYYFKSKLFVKSIYYFKESLSLNCLQPKVLACMGRAAMACDDFKLAIGAFTSILRMDADNYDAWSNLCLAYIKGDDKVRACRCLLETVAFDYRKHGIMRSRTWKNYLLISAKIGAFSEVITCLDLNPPLDFPISYNVRRICSSNVEILKILVNAIKNDVPDIDNVSSLSLKKEAIRLFRHRLFATFNPINWELYSVLLCIGADFRKDIRNTKKIIACQQNAIKLYCRQLRKHKNRHLIEAMLHLILKFLHLFDIYLANLQPGLEFNKELCVFKNFLSTIIRKARPLLIHCQMMSDIFYEVEQKFKDVSTRYNYSY